MWFKILALYFRHSSRNLRGAYNRDNSEIALANVLVTIWAQNPLVTDL